MSELQRNSAIVLRELTNALAKVDEKQFSRVVDQLADADQVTVIGVGREGLAARGFAMRLSHMGIETHWGWDDTTPGVGPGDHVVMVNGSGTIGHLDYVFGKMRAAGATIIVISGVANAATTENADLALVVPAAVYNGTGDLVSTIQPMGSLFEQSIGLVFDLLVLELVTRRSLTFDDLAARHRNFE